MSSTIVSHVAAFSASHGQDPDFSFHQSCGSAFTIVLNLVILRYFVVVRFSTFSLILLEASDCFQTQRV